MVINAWCSHLRKRGHHFLGKFAMSLNAFCEHWKPRHTAQHATVPPCACFVWLKVTSRWIQASG